jgi:class 3 adenylate cyclase
VVTHFQLRSRAVENPAPALGWSHTPGAGETRSTATRLARLERRAAAGHQTRQPAAPIVGEKDETKRKIATIVFADVIGSTELSRSVDLDCWWSVIGRVFEDMCESIERFGGWVEGFTGDGIMAVFETTLGQGRSEHACRACQAALWLRDAMGRCSEDLGRIHGVVVSVRIGVHSGEVVTGKIGRRYGRHYTAGGYAVALAKRIETLAAPGAVYVSEQTTAYLEPATELRDLGTFTVKGARAPVHVFELVGRR